MPLVSDRTRFALLGAVIALCTGNAYRLRFMQDDAFISFRYSYNFVHGHGLVWNVGERVQGYTNFLWTLLMAVPIAMHGSVVRFSYALGLACFACSLLLIYRIARFWLNEWAALAVVLVAGLNRTFAMYATGGMETSLETTLVMACLLAAVTVVRAEKLNDKALLTFSLCSAAALFTRLDSAIYIAVFEIAIWVRMERARARWESWVALFTPQVLLVGALLAWQWWYYGQMLPNTFYLKIGYIEPWVRFVNGVLYDTQFFVTYLFFPLLLLPLFAWRRLVREPGLVMLAFAGGAQTLYVLYAGGDFMEYRFMVPAIPLFLLLLVWAAWNTPRWVAIPVLLVALLVGIVEPNTIRFLPEKRRMPVVESREELAAPLGPPMNWIGVGQALDRVFHQDPSVTIAVRPAGAVPFYSELPAIDMLGPNDAWVARYGNEPSRWPGHYRLAPLSYLIERHAVLLIMQPTSIPHDAPMATVYHAWQVLQRGLCDGACNLPPTARLLRLPIDAQNDEQIVYVFPNRAVDEAIEREHLAVSPIVP